MPTCPSRVLPIVCSCTLFLSLSACSFFAAAHKTLVTASICLPVRPCSALLAPTVYHNCDWHRRGTSSPPVTLRNNCVFPKIAELLLWTYAHPFCCHLGTEQQDVCTTLAHGAFANIKLTWENNLHLLVHVFICFRLRWLLNVGVIYAIVFCLCIC